MEDAADFSSDAKKIRVFAVVFGALVIAPLPVVTMLDGVSPNGIDPFWKTGSIVVPIVFLVPFVVAIMAAFSPPRLRFSEAGVTVNGIGGTMTFVWSDIKAIEVDIDTTQGRPSPWLVITPSESASIPRKTLFFPSPTPSRSVEGGLKVFPLTWLGAPYTEVESVGRRLFPSVWT